MLFAVAFRSDEPSIADVQGMVDGVQAERATRIDLRGLLPPEVAEVMRRVSGADPDPRVAAAVQARTGGHPLFVTELVRLLTSEHRLDADGVATALPRRIRDVLRRRLERLPGQTVALLTVVAVAGGTADVDLLAGVTGMDPDAVVDGCEPALLTGLLVEDLASADAFTLSHDLVRQTLAESVSAARRIRLHAKIATALQARGTLTPQQVVDLAHHLSLAAPVVGPAAAIPYLVAAAEDALSRFANDAAEQSLREALDLARQVPDPAERVALERQMEGRLAIFLAYTRGSVLPPRPDAAPQAPPPTDPESAAGWLGTAIMTGVSGDYPATVRLAEQALAVQLVPVASAAAHYALAFGHFMSGRVDVARREYAAVEGLLSALGSDLPGLLASLAVSVATYSAMAAHMEGDEAAADAWMTTAAARGTASDVAAINVALGRCWLAGMRGNVEEARAAATTCGGFAERMDYPLFALQARIVSGWADALAGDAAGAERADLAREEYAATGVRLFLPFHLLLCAEAHAATGDTATAARLVTRSRVVSLECGDVCRSPRLLSFGEGLVPAS